ATATVTSPGPNYPIVPSAAIGTGLGNYNISYANGTLTVNPATPVVCVVASSTQYSDPATVKAYVGLGSCSSLPSSITIGATGTVTFTVTGAAGMVTAPSTGTSIGTFT